MNPKESKFKAATMLVYDIPQGSKIPNPSDVLRRRGVRINLSCWIIPDDRVPFTLIDELKKGGAVVYTVHYDTMELDKIKALAFDLLKQEVARIRATLGATLAKSIIRYAKAKEQSSADGVNSTTQYVKFGLRRAKHHLNSAQESATAFDILADANDLFNALRFELATQTELWFTQCASWKEKAGTMGGSR